MKKLTLPNTVYVTVANEGTDDAYLSSDCEASPLIEDDGPTVIGTYKLTKIQTMAKTTIAREGRVKQWK